VTRKARSPGAAFVALALVVCTGCGTLFRGTHQTVHFESIPPGVDLRDVRTGETCVTPADVSLWRTRRHVFLATKAGYKSQDVYIDSRGSFVWYYANIVTLFLGLAVDAVAGGLYDLEPANVVLVMEADGAPAPQPPAPN
jgi:hypothetical protein